MNKYLDVLPNNCKDKEEGIVRAVIIDDMIKQETMFAEMELKSDGNINCFLKDSLENILEALYRSENPMVIWNKSLDKNAALFKFDEYNQKAIMLFPMSVPGFKQSFLENVINVKGGDKMAKICPITKDFVLYLDCKECENRSECEVK